MYMRVGNLFTQGEVMLHDVSIAVNLFSLFVRSRSAVVIFQSFHFLSVGSIMAFSKSGVLPLANFTCWAIQQSDFSFNTKMDAREYFHTE